MSGRFWIRLALGVLFIPIILFGLVIAIANWKQDDIVQELISKANEDFTGELRVADMHISPFVNFP